MRLAAWPSWVAPGPPEPREQEYGQVISGCAELAARVQAMTAAGHFGYAELGEMDAALRRLSLRWEKIRTRDVLAAANAGTAESSLARCYPLLDEFAQGVYQAEVVQVTGNESEWPPPGALNWR